MARLLLQDKIQPHWWCKTFIGIFMGLLLSYGLIALFAWFGPDGLETGMKVQFNMWMISAIWLPILTLIYLFKTARSAFIYLLFANVCVYFLFVSLWWLQ
ncbi:hypothetical protein L2737_16850 [Shewanella electrodiphila]|uniref:Uncharacterized protein n=1 Tax=Shewanella electrodiphila TaxID=934143 RepID=A0ABT0KT60_9GAMM|nr:hypothetical protein [Shewanella electrodiphila]MCL1046969.1 hypothetical protein [Shewanella electrodiphila]